MFSCRFCEIFKNTYFYRTPLVVASDTSPKWYEEIRNFHLFRFFIPFETNAPFLYPLKTSENVKILGGNRVIKQTRFASYLQNFWHLWVFCGCFVIKFLYIWFYPETLAHDICCSKTFVFEYHISTEAATRIVLVKKVFWKIL